MDPFEFEFEVNPKHSYVTGTPPREGDRIHITGNNLFALVVLERGDERIDGIRLSPEDMDKLCKEWTDARRVCPFCHKPGMDVEYDEMPHFENVNTRWKCEHCGGATDIMWESGDVAWDDPLGDTR